MSSFLLLPKCSAILRRTLLVPRTSGLVLEVLVWKTAIHRSRFVLNEFAPRLDRGYNLFGISSIDYEGIWTLKIVYNVKPTKLYWRQSIGEALDRLDGGSLGQRYPDRYLMLTTLFHIVKFTNFPNLFRHSSWPLLVGLNAPNAFDSNSEVLTLHSKEQRRSRICVCNWDPVVDTFTLFYGASLLFAIIAPHKLFSLVDRVYDPTVCLGVPVASSWPLFQREQFVRLQCTAFWSVTCGSVHPPGAVVQCWPMWNKP